MHQMRLKALEAYHPKVDPLVPAAAKTLQPVPSCPALADQGLLPCIRGIQPMVLSAPSQTVQLDTQNKRRARMMVAYDHCDSWIS